MNDRVWVVVESREGEMDVHVFEHEADARNYSQERLGGEGVCACACACPDLKILSTQVHRREELAEDDSPWGVEIPGVNATFVEGLLEEIEFEASEVTPQEISEEFFRVKGEKLKQEAAELVHDFVMDELRDYLEHGADGCLCPED